MATFKHDDLYVAAFVWAYFENASFKGLEPKDQRGARVFFNVCIDVPGLPERNLQAAIDGYTNDAVDVPARFYAEKIRDLHAKVTREQHR
jgi:hypothetical protein